MTRVLLWLFAAPAVALLVVASVAILTPKLAIATALVGQALALPCWHALERRRTLEALREYRHKPGARVVRFRFDALEAVAQLALRFIAALIVAVVTLVISR